MTKHFSRHFWCVAYSQQLLYTVPGAFQVDTKFIPRSFPSSLQGHSKVIPSSFQVHSKCSPSSFLVHILSIALTCITVLVQKRWAHLIYCIGSVVVWWCTFQMHRHIDNAFPSAVTCLCSRGSSAFPDL